METTDKNKIRLLFVDILKGYTEVFYKDSKVYFKHNTSLESGNIDFKKQDFLKKAKSKGLHSEEEKEKYLISEKLWSKQQNEEIEKIRLFISNLKTTKSKLFKNEDINIINDQINEQNIKLIQLISERKELLGFTAEDYANKKINEYYMFNSLFKDNYLKQRFFSEDEFDELENKDISEIIKIYSNINRDFSDKNLKKIALSSFYLSLYNICDDNPYYLYGKPIIDLTFYQMEIFSYSRYFRNVLSEVKHKPSDDLYDDPDKLLDWLESSKNAEEMLDKVSKKENTKSEGAIGTSIIGAKKEDLAKIGVDEKGINLHNEALKKGGVLSMDDLMKLHGVK